LSIALAFADSIPTGDPVIRTGGGSGSVSITSPIFTIVTPTGNSPTDATPCIYIYRGISTPSPGCFFSNHLEEGGTIHEMVFVASKAYSGTLSCALSTALGGISPWFTKCAAPAGGRVVEFFGGPGIPFGDEFSLGFRGFNANASFLVIAIAEDDHAGTASPAPEPVTLALFASGIGAVLVRRRSRVR
jgi:hypothetical protein